MGVGIHETFRGTNLRGNSSVGNVKIKTRSKRNGVKEEGNTLTRDFFSTLSSLCTHHIVAEGVARRVCIKHVYPHVITCLRVCCFLVLSSSSVSRASTFSLTSTCSLS